jgi:hypothetical protein
MYWELGYSIVFLVECTTVYLTYLLNNLGTGYNTWRSGDGEDILMVLPNRQVQVKERSLGICPKAT